MHVHFCAYVTVFMFLENTGESRNFKDSEGKIEGVIEESVGWESRDLCSPLKLFFSPAILMHIFCLLG